MRIVTYNLRGGGASRTHWRQIVEAFDPDIFLVQESAAPTQHLAESAFHPGVVWNPVAKLHWGSAVYAPRAQAQAIALSDFHGNVAGAELTGQPWSRDGRRLFAFSVHVPDRRGYAAATNAILAMLVPWVKQGDVVIGGDFNLEICSRPASDATILPKAILAIHARLHDEFGLVNCWRAANQDTPAAQTLRWARDKTTPYHCDGIFVPQAWVPRLQSCQVITGEEWDALSDHNPVVAEFEALQV